MYYPPRREAISRPFRKLLNKVAKNLTHAVTKLRFPIEGAMPTSSSSLQLFFIHPTLIKIKRGGSKESFVS
jgi:hypothetical protein